MNLSTNNNKIVRTFDGAEIKEGMMIYIPSEDLGRILSFKVKHWHNGVNSLLYYPSKSERNNCTISIKGYGGAGIYLAKDQKDYNPYSFVLCKDCFSSLTQARKAIENRAKRKYLEYLKIKNSALDIEPELIQQKISPYGIFD